MKKKVLMSIALLAIIGTIAVFAQSPTLNKLEFSANGNTALRAKAKDKNITGAVVVPGEYNGKPVNLISDFGDTKITSIIILEGVIRIHNATFSNCNELTSVTCPASLKEIGPNAFVLSKLPKLTTITFKGDWNRSIDATGFGGDTGSFNISKDLIAKYQAGGAGTYTRSAGSNTWTKQGGKVCPACGRPL